jgi:hypothetical protein
LAIVASLTYGAELLGVQLQSATLDQLRDAVKKSGALLIREGGENQWFDVYDSQNLLPGSTRMYLGYAKQSRQLAFVEYEFIGLQQPVMLSKLQIKYGNPKTQKGQYISDVRYRWRQDGIEIELAADWEKYRTRLSYINPLVLQDLKKEQAQAVVASSTDQQSRY